MTNQERSSSRGVLVAAAAIGLALGVVSGLTAAGMAMHSSLGSSHRIASTHERMAFQVPDTRTVSDDGVMTPCSLTVPQRELPAARCPEPELGPGGRAIHEWKQTTTPTFRDSRCSSVHLMVREELDRADRVLVASADVGGT
jgi:hypothetical protein